MGIPYATAQGVGCCTGIPYATAREWAVALGFPMQQPKKWTCCIGIPLTAEEVHCGTWIPYATAQAPQIHLSKGQYRYEEAMTRSKLENDSQIMKKHIKKNKKP